MNTWIPDWHDETKYPFSSLTPSVTWAWEFLRRRSDYQNDFEIEVRPHIASDGSFDYSSPEERAFRERYGLALLPSPPELDYAPFFRWRGVSYVANHDAYQGPPGFETELRHIRPGDAWVKVDLDLPITEQLKRIENVLMGRQKAYLSRRKRNLPKIRVLAEKWRLYLRLLDAEAVGASPSEMAAVLRPRKQNSTPDYPVSREMRADLRSAHRLMNHYRLIASLR